MLLHRLYEKAIHICPIPEGDEERRNLRTRWERARTDHADMIEYYDPFEKVPKLKAAELPVADGVESIFPVEILVGE